MKIDRRKKTRHQLPCGVNYVYHSGSYLVGKVINLSDQGLSFEYSSVDQRTTDTMVLDILSSVTGLSHLAQITCLRVYDIRAMEERQSFRGTAIRRCGVQFFSLNADQRWDIEHLIFQQSTKTSDACRTSYPA